VNIQDFGSIGELLAALATIATLIYLARQVNANTRATQASSRLEISREYRTTARVLFDVDIQHAWSYGLKHYPDMPFEQGSRFANYFSDQALLFQGVFALYDHDQLEEETYGAYLNWFSALVATPGGMKWWEAIGRQIFVANAVSVVDERIAQGGLPDLLQLEGFKDVPDLPVSMVAVSNDPGPYKKDKD
jgi:hypothetical protein